MRAKAQGTALSITSGSGAKTAKVLKEIVYQERPA